MKDHFDDEELKENIEDHEEMSQRLQKKKGPKDNYYLVKLLHSSETFYAKIVNNAPEYKSQTLVVSETRYGKDVCRILGKVHEEADPDNLFSIIRELNEKDHQRWKENAAKEEEAYQICQRKIEYFKLDMNLISAHFLLDEPKVLFFFTAESRVDFRELVKELVSVFRIRIELRQIGVRDEARVLGGTGVCGRQFCCHAITDKLRPVSIKMAKEQKLSLNTTKISGPCGRLLCCLSYEYDFYNAERKKYPEENATVLVGKESFRVNSLNILSRRVGLQARDGRVLDIPFDALEKSSSSSWRVKKEVLDDLE